MKTMPERFTPLGQPWVQDPNAGTGILTLQKPARAWRLGGLTTARPRQDGLLIDLAPDEQLPAGFCTDLRRILVPIALDDASAAALNRIACTVALFWKAISAIDAGSVKTTWKYGTGSSSASRSASHAARAGPWHFGQWRLRHEL